MPLVNTRDEALESLRSGLAQWAADALGVLTQARARADAAIADVEAACGARANRVAALRSALVALREGEDPGPVLRAIADAENALARARRAREIAQRGAAELRALERQIGETLGSKVPAAVAALQRRLGSLETYRAGGTSGGSAPSGAQSPSGGDGNREAAALAQRGLVSVPIANARYDDNPVLDGYHRGDVGLGDYRWAVETWHTVVRPGVAAGATREDFERRDAERGATGLRRTAGVYDIFLGTGDRLRFSRNGDGSLDVINGRHRLDVARALGITHLPGELT
jgi:hypothetical protein